MNSRIPIALCIDVEPDPQRPRPANPEPWRGFEQLFPYLQRFRTRMNDATGEPARLNWFWRVDPQVEIVYGSGDWALKRYEDEIGQTLGHGDAHGVHPHAWRWESQQNDWVSDYDDTEWLEYCIETSFTAFRSVFGRPCESVRMGNRFFDTRILTMLESRGCRYDLTTEPGEKPEPHLPQDYRMLQMGPYRPSVRDFTVPDLTRAEGIWIIPLASGVMPERGLTWLRALRRYVSASGPVPTGYGTLRLWEPPELVQPAIQETLSRALQPYLAFAIRSDVLRNPWWGRNCQKNLEELLKQPHATRFQFCTPPELLSVYNAPRLQEGNRSQDHAAL